MSDTVRSTVFDREPCASGVVGAKDVDINEAWEGIFWGFVLFIWTEMVCVIDRSGWRLVHAAYEENRVKYIVVKPASLLYCIKSNRMDRVVIQYLSVRFVSDDVACRMPVSDSNAYSCVRSLGMVG